MSNNRRTLSRIVFGWMGLTITVLIPGIARSQSVTAEALIADGDKFFEAANFVAATESYKKAIAVKPIAEAYNHLGQAFQAQKKYPEAVTAFLKAVQIKPADSSNHLYLANTYLEMQKYTEAVSAAKEAVRLKPDWGESYNTLGTAYFRLEEFPSAEAAFRNAVRLDTKHRVYLRNLTKTLIEQRKTAEARTSIEQLRKLDVLLASEMRHDIEDFIELSRENASNLLEPGFAAMDDDDYGNALRYFRHALLLKPRREDLPLAHYGKASAHYWLNEDAKAMFHIREAIRLDPKDARYPSLLGHIYVQMGNKAGAKQTYNKLIRIDAKLAASLLEAIKKMK